MAVRRRSFCKSPGGLAAEREGIAQAHGGAGDFFLVVVRAREKIERHGIGAGFHGANVWQVGERTDRTTVRDELAFWIEEQERDARLPREFQRDLDARGGLAATDRDNEIRTGVTLALRTDVAPSSFRFLAHSTRMRAIPRFSMS